MKDPEDKDRRSVPATVDLVQLHGEHVPAPVSAAHDLSAALGVVHETRAV